MLGLDLRCNFMVSELILFISRRFLWTAFNVWRISTLVPQEERRMSKTEEEMVGAVRGKGCPVCSNIRNTGGEKEAVGRPLQ